MPRIADKAAIRAILNTDRRWAAYALGDLAPALFGDCEWFCATADRQAIALVYRAFEIPVLFTLGQAAAVEGILEEIADEPRMYLSIRPEILPLIKERYAVRDETAMWRMVLDRSKFRPEPMGACARLGPMAVQELGQLYTDGRATGEAPTFFVPRMLEEGVYFGVREGGDLVSAAGTHLLAPEEGVAAMGNVYTRRDRRGRGWGGAVTRAVAGELLRMRIDAVALNVAQSNASAIRMYERVGFARYCAFYEGVASRRTS
jgi:ribosomal protein S18 acetylase RimI-like enzyme